MTDNDKRHTSGLLHQHAMLRLFVGVAFGVLPLSSASALGQMPVAGANQNSAAKSRAETFEVATIKAEATGPGRTTHTSLNIYPNGRVLITGYTLKELICAAYHLNYWQVKGGGGWIDNDSYNVEAIAPNATDGMPTYNIHHDLWSFEDSTLQTMLQALLEDRFKLKTHLVVTEGPVYLLERGDGVLALTPNKQDGGFGGIGARSGVGYVLLNTSMPQLAAYLSSYVFHRTVIDKTGLAGTYDFESKTALSDDDLKQSYASRILPAVKEMGLTLTKSTGPVTELVIDSASRPSAN